MKRCVAEGITVVLVVIAVDDALREWGWVTVGVLGSMALALTCATWYSKRRWDR